MSVKGVCIVSFINTSKAECQVRIEYQHINKTVILAEKACTAAECTHDLILIIIPNKSLNLTNHNGLSRFGSSAAHCVCMFDICSVAPTSTTTVV